MKTTILKDNFRQGLTAASRICQKNPTLPILNSVLIVCEKNFVCLKATDLEIGLKRWILSKVDKEGKVACPLRIIQGVIDSSFSEKITLKSDEKKLYLEADDLNVQINGIDAEEFPIIPEPETEKAIILDSSSLSQGLAQVLEMAAVSAIKPEISGVYFRFSKNRLIMTATDSFRLAEKTVVLDKQTGPDQETCFILPQKACREIINIFGEENNELKLYLSPNQLVLESLMAETSHPKVQFFSRLIEGEYPNYQEVIPREFAFEISVSKNDFLQRLKTVGLFSNKISEIKLKIDSQKQEIELGGENPEIGQSSARLSANIRGQGLAEISFNWRFLVDGLNQIKDKQAVLSLSRDKEKNEQGPAVLKPEQESDYFYLLMPLRT